MSLGSITGSLGFLSITGSSWGCKESDMTEWLNNKQISVFSPDVPGDSVSKESSCSAGDLGLIPGSGRSFEGGNGSPIQDSCWDNHMDRGACQALVHGVAKSFPIVYVILT